MSTPPHIFIFGLGYVGRHLAQLLSQNGWQITATTRQPGRLAGQLPDSWRLLPFSAEAPLAQLDTHLATATHLISSIAPQAGQDPVLAHHADEIAAFTGWTGYLSATSVYPDQPEGWVDEDTPAVPVTARGTARLAAEQKWQEAGGVEIFRLAGIYGPGRNALADLRAGKAHIIDKPGQVFNRIHQSDISRVIAAAMAQPRPGRIINLADHKPASQGDVVRYAAQLLGMDPPQAIAFAEAEMSEMARSFYTAQRRIRSQIIGPELGLELFYPDYESGLKAILAAEQG